MKTLWKTIVAGSIVLGCMVSGTTVQAQDVIVVAPDASSQRGLHLGVKFLPGFSSLSRESFQDGMKFRGNVEYGYGASLAYFFNNHVNLELEVSYSSVIQDMTDAYDVNRTVDLAYLNVPLLLGFHTNFGRPVNLGITAGPQLGILTGSKVDVKDNPGENPTDVEAVLEAKPYDIGIAYGAGLDFGLGRSRNTHLGIGVRAFNGLVNLDNSDVQENGNDKVILLKDSHTNVYSAYIGLRFKL